MLYCGSQPYCVCSSGQWSPLDRGSTVTAIVPQHNLPRVSPAHHQVGMKSCKAHRHHRRLRRKKQRCGGNERAEHIIVFEVSLLERL